MTDEEVTAQNTDLAVDLPDPVFMLSAYDPYVRDQRIKLYPWQIRAQRQVTRVYEDKVNRMSVCANNGSGKSSYTISPAAVFLGMRYYNARSVITSASGYQLDRQTGRQITRICENINKAYDEEIWKIRYREYTNELTGSTVEMFATDEAGKAEGYHPHVPKGKFLIGVDEAKTVEQNIFESLARCNGVTHRLDVSSPGAPTGHFYNTQISPRWWSIRVTYKDCPHISEDEVEEAREMYGENSPLFRSMYLAEFTSVDEQIVIRFDTIKSLLRAIETDNLVRVPCNWGLTAGLDLAAGGDENVFSIFDGLNHIGLEPFRFSDTTLTVQHVKKLIHKYGIDPSKVNADDGGVGKAIIDQLWRDGYRVNRVINQGRAFNSRVYGNRGAEMWFNFARFVEECNIKLINDRVLLNQLSSRYYKQRTEKMFLESKQDARAKGHQSPDRADATVLAFAHIQYGSWHDKAASDSLTKERNKRVIVPSTEQLIRMMDEIKYSDKYIGIGDIAIANPNLLKAIQRHVSRLKKTTMRSVYTSREMLQIKD